MADLYFLEESEGINVFTKNRKLIDKVSDAKTLEKNHGKNNLINILESKDIDFIRIALAESNKNLENIRKKAIFEAKKSISKAIGKDRVIIEGIKTIDELTKSINSLSKKLRDFYELYNPEFSRTIESNEKFCEIINSGKDSKKEGSMGSKIFMQEDTAFLKLLAGKIVELNGLRKKAEDYIEQKMIKEYLNLSSLATPKIGARLIEKAGSFEKIVMMPASRIQVLGAEKALFRFLKTNSRPPKHGILFEHPNVQDADKKDKGRIARILSDKISMAAKIDYFSKKDETKNLLRQVKEAIKK